MPSVKVMDVTDPLLLCISSFAGSPERLTSTIIDPKVAVRLRVLEALKVPSIRPNDVSMSALSVRSDYKKYEVQILDEVVKKP
jgi:hypothetical protein